MSSLSTGSEVQVGDQAQGAVIGGDAFMVRDHQAEAVPEVASDVHAGVGTDVDLLDQQADGHDWGVPLQGVEPVVVDAVGCQEVRVSFQEEMQARREIDHVPYRGQGSQLVLVQPVDGRASLDHHRPARVDIVVRVHLRLEAGVHEALWLVSGRPEQVGGRAHSQARVGVGGAGCYHQELRVQLRGVDRRGDEHKARYEKCKLHGFLRCCSSLPYRARVKKSKFFPFA